MPDSVLFLTLRIFSATGGIEKMCRIMGKALFEKSKKDYTDITVLSSHDNSDQADGNPYFPAEWFRGYSSSKWRFIFSAVRKGIGKTHVVISHINLLPAGWLIKLFSPRTRVILMAHGIEVWDLPLGINKYLLGACDRIICVSEFTREKIISQLHLPASKCMVLNNCLDPYIPELKANFDGNQLRSKHGINKDDQVLFTLTRMKSSERYKGYDRVIEALSGLADQYPQLKYIIGGACDTEEEQYVRSLIREQGLDGKVILAGYIDDNDIPAYFQSADIYIMPSYREGFGIVFIEAMYYGLPVIAGNKDGSVDALGAGELGCLTDPMDTGALAVAIRKLIEERDHFMPDQQKLMARFGYRAYREKFLNAMNFN